MAAHVQHVKDDILSFREKGEVDDFNATVGKVADDDDVIGKLEATCNASGNKLISLLHYGCI